MRLLLIFISFFSISVWSFDKATLKELEKINKSSVRKCSSGSISLKIEGSTIKITDNSKKKNKRVGKYKEYNIYDESADFILSDHLTTTNLEYAKNNFFPELIIFKKKNKVLLIEGLSFKFQKKGINENCKGDLKTNLHCYSKGYNTNIAAYNKKIKMTFNNQKIRDLAQVKLKEVDFAYDLFDFHSENVKIGNNGSMKRSVALIDSGEVVNFTYSHKKAKVILTSCDLSLK